MCNLLTLNITRKTNSIALRANMLKIYDYTPTTVRLVEACMHSSWLCDGHYMHHYGTGNTQHATVLSEDRAQPQAGNIHTNAVVSRQKMPQDISLSKLHFCWAGWLRGSANVLKRVNNSNKFLITVNLKTIVFSLQCTWDIVLVPNMSSRMYS